MVPQDYKIDGEYLCISKEELETWRDHYYQLACHHKTNNDSFRQSLYIGKHSVMCDMLKMFEPLEG